MIRLPAAVLGLVLVAGCSASTAVPAAAVTQDEASQVLAELVALADEQTQQAASTICDLHSCIGLSSGEVFSLQSHPGPTRPVQELCSVQLPALEGQLGSRLLVVEGTDTRDRTYVSQLLVERLGDRVVVHEPAYWLGVRYTSLRVGSSTWSGAGDGQSARQRHLERARQPCEDQAAFLDDVTGA